MSNIAPTVESVREILASKRNSLLRRTSPADVGAGTRLKHVLRGRPFSTTEELAEAIDAVLQYAPPNTADDVLLAILGPCAADWQELSNLFADVKRTHVKALPGVHERLAEQARIDAQAATAVSDARIAALERRLASQDARLTTLENLLRGAGVEIPTVDGSGTPTPAED